MRCSNRVCGRSTFVPGSIQPRAGDGLELAVVLGFCLHLCTIWAWDQPLRVAGDGLTELSLGVSPSLAKERLGTKAAGRGVGKGAGKGEKR